MAPMGPASSRPRAGAQPSWAAGDQPPTADRGVHREAGHNAHRSPAGEFGEEKVREGVACAMQSKNRAWFKTIEGGQALGDLLLELGLPQEVDEVLWDFWQRVQQEAAWD